MTDLLKGFEKRHPGKGAELSKSPDLLVKGFVFLHRKVCERCRIKTLNNVRNGNDFKRDDLCKDCKVKYDKEVA